MRRVREINVPLVWQNWSELARAALEPGPAILPDQLLLVRNMAGHVARPLEPPQGIVARPGAVLILLYPDGSDLRLPLTVRSDRLPNHRGEVSLPGGATDPEDNGPHETALRECYEELGIETHTITVWGTLSPIYIAPSNFHITPIVGFVSEPPALRLNHDEVNTVITVTLRELLDPQRVVVEQWSLRGHDLYVPFFQIDGYKVWGATALILSEFVARMRGRLTE